MNEVVSSRTRVWFLCVCELDFRFWKDRLSPWDLVSSCSGTPPDVFITLTAAVVLNFRCSFVSFIRVRAIWGSVLTNNYLCIFSAYIRIFPKDASVGFFRNLVFIFRNRIAGRLYFVVIWNPGWKPKGSELKKIKSMFNIISAISLEYGTRVRKNKCYLLISGLRTLGFKHPPSFLH